MNDLKSWDPSLVKKYSSSNHYKLLNQLRNEVKKYPLNNKKNTASHQTKEKNFDNNMKSKVSRSINTQSSNNSTITGEENKNNSSISFNNAKNFSIYNQKTNNNVSQKTQNVNTDNRITSNNGASPTFKDRLDQVDMK